MEASGEGNIRSRALKEKLQFTKLKNFFKESRKAQTVYSEYAKNKNEEFDCQEKSSIKEFLIHELFLNKKTESTCNLNKIEEDLVKNLTEKIIEVSPSDNSKTCVRIIWVFYFVHEGAMTKCIPVFKIYKNLRENEVKYLDVFLKDYSFWDDFIEKVALSKSLMCVPRNGEYSLEGGNLNLDYIVKDLKLDLNGPYRLVNLANFQPVSMVLSTRIDRKHLWLCVHSAVSRHLEKIINICKKHKMSIFYMLLQVLSVILSMHSPFLLRHPRLLGAVLQIINAVCNFLKEKLIPEDCKVVEEFDKLKSSILFILKHVGFQKELMHQPYEPLLSKRPQIQNK